MKEKNDLIKERESWLKIGVIIFFCLVIGIPLFWNLITGKININFSNIDFESLLAVIISFFSIYLSILFYFKATDSSNQFYNNSYTFTKDISETLRGIEAGFGEKLKNIDKGYEDFRKSFENYVSPAEKSEIKKEVEEEKNKLKEIIIQKESLISELEKKTNLSKQDLNKYLKQIRIKEQELSEKNEQIKLIKTQLQENEYIPINRNEYLNIKRYLQIKFLPLIDINILCSSHMTRRYFRKYSKTFNQQFLSLMQAANLVDARNELTSSGINFIQQIAQNK